MLRTVKLGAQVRAPHVTAQITSMRFASLDEVLAHRFIVGNKIAAYDAIERFARDEQHCLEDRAAALWHRGRAGMGLSPEENLEHLTPRALIQEFLGVD